MTASAMPRYFFDIDGSVSARDDQGQDCADHNAALTEAFRRAATYAATLDFLKQSGVVVMTVRDGPHPVIFKLRLACQVEDFRFGANLSLGGILD